VDNAKTSIKLFIAEVVFGSCAISAGFCLAGSTWALKRCLSLGGWDSIAWTAIAIVFSVTLALSIFSGVYLYKRKRGVAMFRATGSPLIVLSIGILYFDYVWLKELRVASTYSLITLVSGIFLRFLYSYFSKAGRYAADRDTIYKKGLFEIGVGFFAIVGVVAAVILSSISTYYLHKQVSITNRPYLKIRPAKLKGVAKIWPGFRKIEQDRYFFVMQRPGGKRSLISNVEIENVGRSPGRIEEFRFVLSLPGSPGQLSHLKKSTDEPISVFNNDKIVWRIESAIKDKSFADDLMNADVAELLIVVVYDAHGPIYTGTRAPYATQVSFRLDLKKQELACTHSFIK